MAAPSGSLKTASGDLFDVQAGPEIKNFDKIVVGDVVKATYTESVAFKIVPNTESAGGVTQTVNRVPGGAEVAEVGAERKGRSLLVFSVQFSGKAGGSAE